MRIICVDDEALDARYAASICAKLPRVDEVEYFLNAAEALRFFETQTAEIVLLDVDMPDINGIMLAAKINRLRPHTQIIFLAEDTRYAYHALKVHAAGFVLKPVDEAELTAEIEYALSNLYQTPSAHIVVKTFGGFDLFVDGRLVTFERAKSKELLALLIDRRGGSMTRREISTRLWENHRYDRAMQKRLDTVIRSMRDTLKKHGVDEIFEMINGQLRIVPETINCDMYRFFDGDVEVFNAYRGEYMTPYAWASMSEGLMTWKWGEDAGDHDV